MTNNTTTNKKCILLAEAESHVRQAIRLMIQYQEDLEVMGEVGTAESLLIQVCKQTPDIILLDWSLPSIHHQRLLIALKECCPNAVIIAMSVRPEAEQAALELGADAFVLKNLPPEEFIEVILRTVSLQKS